MENHHGTFTVPIRVGDKTKQIMVVSTTCSWCRYPGTQCAATLRPAGMLHLAEGSRQLYAIVRALCHKCFQEYWAAGGLEMEIERGSKHASDGAV